MREICVTNRFRGKTPYTTVTLTRDLLPREPGTGSRVPIAHFTMRDPLNDEQWHELRRWLEAAEIGPWLVRHVS